MWGESKAACAALRWDSKGGVLCEFALAQGEHHEPGLQEFYVSKITGRRVRDNHHFDTLLRQGIFYIYVLFH